MSEADGRERGVALLLCLFALMILTSIGLGFLYMSNLETGANSNFRASQEAFFAARAGTEEARDRLRQGIASYSMALPTGAPAMGNGNGVVYITNPSGAADVVHPWDAALTNPYRDDELCHENFPGLNLINPGANVPCASIPNGASWYSVIASKDPNTNTTQSLSYKWVRVTLKLNGTSAPYCPDGTCQATNAAIPVCWNGTTEVLAAGSCAAAGANPVYVITAFALTATGSRRMSQMEVALDPAPRFPGAVTIAGAGVVQCVVAGPPDPSINGNDHASAPPSAGVAGIGTSTAVAFTGCSAGVNNADSIGPAPFNIQPSMVNTSVTPPALDTRLDPAAGLNALLTSIVGNADQTFTGSIPAGSSFGSVGYPMISVLNNVPQIGPISGYGLLIVQTPLASVQIDGDIQWNGVIMLVGTAATVQYQLQPGNGGINGALYMAAPAGQVVQYQSQGGMIKYDSSLVSLAFARVYRVIGSRELMY